MIKKIMLIITTWSFQKMLYNLTCVLIYSLMKCVLEDKATVFWDFCKICTKIFMTEFIVKKIIASRVTASLNKALCQIWFLSNLQNIQIANSNYLNCQICFQ